MEPYRHLDTPIRLRAYPIDTSVGQYLREKKVDALRSSSLSYFKEFDSALCVNNDDVLPVSSSSWNIIEGMVLTLGDKTLRDFFCYCLFVVLFPDPLCNLESTMPMVDATRVTLLLLSMGCSPYARIRLRALFMPDPFSARLSWAELRFNESFFNYMTFRANMQYFHRAIGVSAVTTDQATRPISAFPYLHICPQIALNRATSTVERHVTATYRTQGWALVVWFFGKRFEKDRSVEDLRALASLHYTNRLLHRLTGIVGTDLYSGHFARPYNTQPVYFGVFGFGYGVRAPLSGMDRIDYVFHVAYRATTTWRMRSFRFIDLWGVLSPRRNFFEVTSDEEYDDDFLEDEDVSEPSLRPLKRRIIERVCESE